MKDEQQQSDNNAPVEGDTPEYTEKMVALAEGREPNLPDNSDDQQSDDQQSDDQQSGDAGDELILGKFKTQEDLANAYRELEKKLGSGDRRDRTQLGDDDAAESSEGDEPSSDDSSSDDDSSDDGKAPIDFERFTRSYAQHGELTEDDRAELEKAGFPRSVQDVYLRGLEARIEERTSAAVEAVGGEESFDRVRNWANENLSEAQQAAFNKQLNSAETAEDVAIAWENLAARYAKSKPAEATTVDGDGQVNGSRGFANRDELNKAVADPRYEKDDAYRKNVEAKMVATPWL